MDFLMVGTLIICFLLVIALAFGFETQVEEQYRSISMLALGILIAALCLYLVYALANPEKF